MPDRITAKYNGQEVDVDVLKDPEILAGLYAAARVDPTDSRFVLIEQRQPAALCQVAQLPVKEHGAAVLKAQLYQSLLGIMGILMAVDEIAVARDLISALEENGIVPKGEFFVEQVSPSKTSLSS
jgi:hypothetical protein